MSGEEIVILIQALVLILLPYIGLVITLNTMGDKIARHIDLGFKIICCFIMWGFMGGTKTYTITWTEEDGKERKITIGE